MRHLGIPITVRTGEAMNEYNWWPTTARGDVMDQWHFALWEWIMGIA
jgi:hypothetical protein